MYDLRNFITAVGEIVASHGLAEPGAYRRWNWQDTRSTRDLSLNPYGCADAANILYTVGSFPQDPRERSSWISVLRGLQDEESGMFREPTHHEIHTTAHCIAALELFDALPERPLAKLSDYRDPEQMVRFLEGLDWKHNPWGESVKGAGMYSALVLNREVTREWMDSYYAWLFENSDPESGLFRRGCVDPVEASGVEAFFPHLGGTFHYLFNMEYDRKPLRYPKAMIDTCLHIFNRRPFQVRSPDRSAGLPFGKNVGFAEIDWVFCLTRSLRQCGHRYEECRKALVAFTVEYVPFLLGLDPERDDGLNDLHSLFGALCCLAELQTALPGQIITGRPLKLVLDRRPFI
jgi:hypothetical protein